MKKKPVSKRFFQFSFSEIYEVFLNAENTLYSKMLLEPV